MTVPALGGSPALSPQEVLLQVVTDRYTPGISRHGDLVLTPRRGSRVTHLVNDAGDDLLEGSLIAAAYDAGGVFCTGKQVKTVLSVVRARVARTPPVDVYLRVSRWNDRLYHDLGQPRDGAVRLTAARWTTVRKPNVDFYRTARTQPLPDPSRQGDVDLLRRAVNISSEAWPVLLATLVCNLDPAIPQPIRCFRGRFSTGKTFAARRTSALIDPLNISDWDPPRTARDWYPAAAQAWVVPLDEVTEIKGEFARLLNKAVTGGGTVGRQLYSDMRGRGMQLKRAVAMTTKGLKSIPDDLASRIVQFDMTPMVVRDEEKLEEEWTRIWPLVLGGLYDLTCEVLRVLPEVTAAAVRAPDDTEHRLRFVGFARRLAALDRVLGTDGLSYYQSSERRLSEDVLDADRVTAALKSLIRRKGEISMTAEELRLAITPPGGDGEFPETARKMSAVIEKSEEHLRRAGIGYENHRENSSDRRSLHHFWLMSDSD